MNVDIEEVEEGRNVGTFSRASEHRIQGYSTQIFEKHQQEMKLQQR